MTPENSNATAPRIDVFIPTLNEAKHIRAAVENASRLGKVYVLDSLSTGLGG